jgi:RNA polymerase sigma factor (sigma-70 family)
MLTVRLGEHEVGESRNARPARSPINYSRYAERIGATWPPAAHFAEVLRLAKAGNQAEIGMLYHRFVSAVYRYTLARVSDVNTAEDLTSETFFAMIRGISAARAEDELTFAAWLLGIARNQVLMHFRRVRTQREVSMLPQIEDESQTVAEEGDPLTVLTARESWSETVKAINLLTEEQRTVVLYRCVLGYSTEDVATMMGKRTGTIRALQFRALNSLARQMHIDGESEKPDNSGRRRHHA